MMDVTFLAHSGFFIELEHRCLLFDWWKGELPALPEKPLAVFASHAHEDHFNPAIFSLDDGIREIQFFLGKDIRLSPSHLKKWNVSPETAAKCHRLRGNEQIEWTDLRVETLPSTDAGVAFLVTAGETTIFHAGDLNWWHWEGEPDPWNPDMAKNFQQFCEPLRNRRIDLAMLPLDPRLKEDGFRGPQYILELANIIRFLPMHQWENYAFTEQFLSRYPAFTSQTIRVSQEGESWNF